MDDSITVGAPLDERFPLQRLRPFGNGSRHEFSRSGRASTRFVAYLQQKVGILAQNGYERVFYRAVAENVAQALRDDLKCLRRQPSIMAMISDMRVERTLFSPASR